MAVGCKDTAFPRLTTLDSGKIIKKGLVFYSSYGKCVYLCLC